jgi:hypothetical protein
MTQMELDAAKTALWQQCQGRKMTQYETLLDREYSCREMMISIFAYGGTIEITNESTYGFKQYLSKYVRELGRERFDEVRRTQLQSFEGVTVSRGVYTDGEGCTYNSINWL